MEMKQPNRSPESPGNSTEILELPPSMITYFKKTGRYIENLPSYKRIEGRGADSDFPVNAYGAALSDTYPLMNNNINDFEHALTNCKRMVSIIYQKSNLDDIEIISRDYMVRGVTMPIKVDVMKGSFLNKTLYVKKPSIERIFGYLMYNLISGFESTEFYFNEKVFVEEAITGRVVNEMTMAFIRKNDRFKESAIRLDVLDNLMMINDLDKRDNFIFTPDDKARAFDFDCMLLNLTGRKRFLEYLVSDEGFGFDRKMVNEVREDEKKRLRRVLSNKSKCFDEIVRLMDTMDHFRKIALSYGQKSCKRMFNDRIDFYLWK